VPSGWPLETPSYFHFSIRIRPLPLVLALHAMSVTLPTCPPISAALHKSSGTL
jgi:hypothetical protein